MRHEDVLGDVLAIDAKTMQMHRQSRGGGGEKKRLPRINVSKEKYRKSHQFHEIFFLELWGATPNLVLS